MVNRHRRRNGRALLALVVVFATTAWLCVGPASAATPYDWPQFDDGDWSGTHSGFNAQETAIGSGNVSSLAVLFRAALPSVADGAPAYLSDVTTGSGVKDLLFLTTKDGHILALDAGTGAAVWSHQYGPGTCKVNNGSIACFTTSSPAVDPNRQYVYSYGLDGSVHKYAVGDGAEVTTGGWPETVTLKAFDEKESPALSIASTPGGDYLYVANGGYPGDNGDYQGHVTTINLATGAQKVFNTLCSDQTVHFVETPGTPDCSQVQSAVWARPGVIYDPHTNGGNGSIFFATGNGTFDGNTAAHDWGDSVLELHPDGTGSGGNPIDSYTPTNFEQLQNTDADLGSTAPAILPASAIPSASQYKDVAVQGGKDGDLRLLNLDNLSGQGGPGHVGGEIQIVSVGGQVLAQPAVWVNPADGSIWVFVVGSSTITGFDLTVDSNGIPHLQSQWSQPDGAQSSPLVANGVLYDAHNSVIEARDPVTGSQLWHDTTIGGIHWESPIVANGKLYISDESGNLTAYSLGATYVRVSHFSARRTKGGITFRWTAAKASGLAGFYLTTSHHRLNHRLIARHMRSMYSYTTGPIRASRFQLYTVTLDGHSQQVASTTPRP